MQLGGAWHRLVLAARLALAWRPTAPRLRSYARATLTSFLAIGGMLWILPNLRASGPVSVLVLVLVVFGVGALVRPLLVAVAVLFGSAGLLVVGLITQAVVLDLALQFTPDVHNGPFREVLLASWLVALIAAVVNWVFDVGSDDAFLARVLRQAARAARLDPQRTGEAGLLVIQIDGLGEQVLRQALTAGTVPTISRWLRSGTHRLRTWETGAPATTPAGQAVLLYGDQHHVPGFRWYEKETRRLMVANRPRDAAEIEKRMSDGRGLLADGGVSVANLFTGDAPTRLLTMSDPKLTASARRRVATFAATRGGLPRSIVLMVGEILIELQQGRRQERRDVQPRVSRRSAFVFLRAVTTVLLRNLSVSVVADSLAAGAPVIFVDFLDYDEVAHHAGPSRAEAMRTLDGIDKVLGLLEAVAGQMNRRYEIVVLSDHGQAQGRPFRQHAGQTLAELVTELADSAVDTVGAAAPLGHADAMPAELWGPANVLLTGASRGTTVGGRATRKLLRARTSHDDDGASIILGPAQHTQVHESSRPVVAAGGSLAHVYLPDVPGRATITEIVERFPKLVDGLRRHPQVGLVLVRQDDGSLLALGAEGSRVVTSDGTQDGEGADPTLAYGSRAAFALAQLDTRAHVGDLVLLGQLDAQLNEITAFEDLVGSHGGLGGGQDRAILVTPADWLTPTAELRGTDVHQLLVDRLAEQGLRG